MKKADSRRTIQLYHRPLQGAPYKATHPSFLVHFTKGEWVRH